VTTPDDDLTLTSESMRMAQLNPAVKVYCRACKLVVGCEDNRGDAWVLFAEHVADFHGEPAPKFSTLPRWNPIAERFDLPEEREAP
jgi:hypothetical protein